MPTPQWIKERSLEARLRTCVICENEFFAKKSSHVGKTCSTECLKALMVKNATGRKASAETRAKMRASHKLLNKDQEYKKRRMSAAIKGIRNWHADPKNAEKFSKIASERMKKFHQDPEYLKRKSERSSRVMKETWSKHRELFISQAIERYERMKKNGTGILSEDAKKASAKANKWIMRNAMDALHNETNYNEVYAQVQARLRKEVPFIPGNDYYEYLRWLGMEVTQSHECREIADAFIPQALSKFAKEWRDKNKNTPRH